MTSLRVGVIGLGVGEKHVEGYRAHPRAEVAVVCDLDADHAAAVAARHDVPSSTTDARAVLCDEAIDVVSIASYDSFHFDQVHTALEHGKHVFVEKPLCLSADHARALRELHAAHPDQRLSSNLPLRLSPRFRELKGLIEAGDLGELYYVEGDYEYGRLWKLTDGWRGDEDYYSVTLGGTVHVVDLLLWLTGMRVRRVTAAGNRIATAGSKFRFDDFVVATLEAEGGAIAKVSANFGCVHPHFHALKLFGTRGTFVNGLPDATLWTGDRHALDARVVDAAYPGVHKGDLIHSFLDAICTGAPAEVTEEQVFATMDVLFAIEEAARTGLAVELGSPGVGF